MPTGYSFNLDGSTLYFSLTALFVIRDRRVYTSPLSSGILNGITRDCVMQIARELGFEVVEQVMTLIQAKLE